MPTQWHNASVRSLDDQCSPFFVQVLVRIAKVIIPVVVVFILVVFTIGLIFVGTNQRIVKGFRETLKRWHKQRRRRLFTLFEPCKQLAVLLVKLFDFEVRIVLVVDLDRRP